MPDLQAWMTKQGSMGEDFANAQNTRMGDPEKKKEDDKWWYDNVWPACNAEGHMNLDNYKKMMGLMAAREDELFGKHIEWSEAEQTSQYTNYCKVFGAEEGKGLALDHFSQMEKVFEGAFAKFSAQ